MNLKTIWKYVTSFVTIFLLYLLPCVLRSYFFSCVLPPGGHVPEDFDHLVVNYKNVFLHCEDEHVRNPLFHAWKRTTTAF